MSTIPTTGAALVSWRSRLGWTVTRAADELRIQPTSLRNIEAGRKSASPGLFRLAELLEQLARTTASTATTIEPRPVKSRKPRPKKPVEQPPAEALLAACWHAGLHNLSPKAIAVLQAAVNRRLAGYRGGEHGAPEAGEDLVVWREREVAWHTALGMDMHAPLHRFARFIERKLVDLAPAGLPL